jgi:hypothetical protein
VIEGLKIELSGGELHEHLEGRAEYHAERATFYENQSMTLLAGGVMEGGASNDPVSSLQSSARSHREKQGFFKFLADHLMVIETYRLTEQDLIRLEIVSRYL